MESLLTNLKCSFCSKEYSVQLPLNARINIDCDCGAWGYVSENYEENLYVLDLNKRFGEYLSKLPTRIINNGLYSSEYIDLTKHFSVIIGEDNYMAYKWIKKKE